MYRQDLDRLKAVLFNNTATAYFMMGMMAEAIQFNDHAIASDPDYGKALLRKALIHENQGKYKQAVEVTEYAIGKFDD